MKPLRWPLFSLVAASALATLVTGAARAQPGPTSPPPGVAATAASSPRPGPRLRTPVDTANGAALGGERRPDRPVAPQISIPIGKTPPPPTRAETRAVQRSGAASTAGVDDAAARCEAQSDDTLRAACRAAAAREGRSRAPN